MKYRIPVILSSESASTAATKTIDINIQDPISQIQIELKSTNNGTTPTAHPAKTLTKVELVDGSDVLFSLNGYEGQALDFYNNKKPAVNIISYFDNNTVVPMFHMNFGRYLYDERLALDPKKFSNLQLKITHDKSLGGCSPDAATLEVSAHVFDENKISPDGFLMQKEHYSYSLVSSAYEYIDLPTDHPIRNLMIMSVADDKQPYEQFNELRLSEDNDKRIPFDNNTSDLLKFLCSQYPQYIEAIWGIAGTSAVTFYITPTYEVAVVCGGYAGTQGYFGVANPYGGTCDITGDSAGNNLQAIVKGYAPHGALNIPFGKPNDPDDWYDVRGLGSLQLRAKAGSSVGSSSTCQVVTQQYRKY